MTRWKASAIHFTLSVLLFAALATLVLVFWYPASLLRMSGIDALIGIIVGVDVIAGPLLTLIVYREGKPGLRFDLSVIAFVQLALLAYGLHTLAAVRPVFIVGAVDRFNLVIASDIDPADLALAAPPYNTLSWTGPMLVGAPLPTDRMERSKLVEDSMLGKDIQVQPRYFVPYDQVREAMLQRSSSVAALLEDATPHDASQLRSAIGDQLPESIRFLPLAGTRDSAVMLIDAATGQPIKPVDANPWPRERASSN